MTLSTPLSSGASGESPAARAIAGAGLGGFVANRGQWSEEILFFARSATSEVIVLAEGFWVVPNRGVDPRNGDGAPDPVFVRLPKASAVEPGLELVTRHHFIRASATTSEVPGFESVKYRDVAPGVDVELRRDGAWFAYDVLAGPGADLERFTIVLEGGGAVTAHSAGEFELALGGDALVHRLGAVWQQDGRGVREDLTASVRIDASAASVLRVGFEVPHWDRSQRLVIDPTLLYLTYLGSTTNEGVTDVAVDATGSVYLIGGSPHGPTTPGAFQETPTAATLWIGKLANQGTVLEWGTFLCGSNTQVPVAIEVDADGTVVVTGRVWSTDFPVTPGAVQEAHAGLSDVFVSRLLPDGSGLVWSTFFGGSGQDGPTAMALAGNGDIVLAIDSTSNDVSATPGAFDTVKDPPDKLIVRIAADGTAVRFATWFPAGRIHGIVAGADSSIYFAGDIVPSTGPLPTTPGAFQPQLNGTGLDGYAAKLDATGSKLLWCTYIGGTKSDTIWGLAVDAAGAAYVVGNTASFDFPVTTGALDSVLNHSTGGFAAKITADGRALAWSTYIHSCCTGTGYLEKAAVNAAGNLVAAGFTNQPNWPTTPDAMLPNFVGPAPSSDIVLTKFDALGRTAVYSTHIGGQGSDYEASLALDGAGRPTVAFRTTVPNLPTTAGAYQATHGGGIDIAVAAFDLPLLRWRVHGGQSTSGPHTPNLAATGSLIHGSPTVIAIRGAAPLGPGWLVLGAAALGLPLPELACALFPTPDVLLPIAFDAAGNLDIELAWPLTGSAPLHFQVFGLHPEAPGFVYASNGLRTAP